MSKWNVNSGYGSQVSAALHNAFATGGKVFMVAATAQAGRQILQDLFEVDPDGVNRYASTLDAAIGYCSASRGDVILVAPGHTETLSAADGVDVDIAGVSIIGLGVGDTRPRFTFDDTAAEFVCGADNLYVKDLIFINDVDALIEPIEIEASVDNVTFETCEFRDDTAAKQTIRWFQTADTNTNIQFINCRNIGSDTAGATAWGTFIGGSKHKVIGLTSNGDFSAANIEIKTTLTADILVKDCVLENANAVDVNIEGNSLSNTGWVVNCMCRLATNGQTTWVNNVGGITIYNSFGADNSGEAGQRIGTASSGSIEDDINEILTDTGTTLPAENNVPNADAVTNAKVRDVVGNKTDAAIADTIEGSAATTQSLDALLKAALQRIGADSANNTAATTLVAANDDGSVLERLEGILQRLNGTDGATNVLGADDADNLFASTNVAANRDGSILERLEDIRQNEGVAGGLVYSGAADAGQVASTTVITCADISGKGNDYFNNKYYVQVVLNNNSAGNAPEYEVRKVTDYVSTTGTFTCDAFTQNVEASDKIVVLHESLVTLGRDDADNTIATTNVVANADGSVLERLETIQQAVGGVDSAANVLGADDADNGFASTNVVANDDGSVLERLEGVLQKVSGVDGAANVLGADDADNQFASTNVVANDDGSVLERLEGILQKVTGVDSATNVLGADDADNQFASTNVVANDDGTILERLEGVLQRVSGVDGATNVLGADDADNQFASTNVVANQDGSLLEREEQLQQLAAMAGFYNSANYLAVTADFTNVTWNTAAAHEVATVTGTVRMLILPEVTGTVTSAGGNATLVFGDETTTNSIIASSDAEGLAQGEWWVDATVTRTVITRTLMNGMEVCLANGKDVGYTIGTEALTGGSIVFHIWWVPINATGAVAAGAGGGL